jgi:hypothetical protein
MNLQNSQNRIRDLMARFVSEVKAATALDQTDINRIAETVLIPLLSQVLNLPSLVNLNTVAKNYPAVDLGDERARVAIQVTSTPDSEKIKHTLQEFIQHNLHLKFDRLYVYILTEKQKSYSGRGFDTILNGKIQFDKDTDILDYCDLLDRMRSFDVAQARTIENLLEANFVDGAVPLIIRHEEPKTESVCLNLVDVTFPDCLYIADVSLDEDDLWDAAYAKKSRRKRYVSTRDLVAAALTKRGLRFAADWWCHANQILTFHDLRDSSLPLSHIVDRGTVTQLKPEEFYGQDADHERVFKSLLWKCLQQKLFRQSILWQNQENMFIFCDDDGEDVRKEQWRGKKQNERTVYKRVMKTHKPDEVFYCSHFAFHTQFLRFDKVWYLSVVPDWFFSWDGYHRSAFGAKKIAYLKKNEWNTQVFNHFRFITYTLCHEKPSDLFEQRELYPFLTFGKTVDFDNAPLLDDDDWLPGEDKDERKKMQDAAGDLTLEVEP